MAINKAMRAALRALSRHDVDVRTQYEQKRRMVNAIHPPLASPFRIWDHLITLEDHTIPVRLFTPPEPGPHPVLLFFHGGGWVTGNIESYTAVCSRMARLTGHLVISVDYRLAPEHPFPAGLEDCYAAAREVFCNCESLGICHRQITLIGDSAGGNLTAAVSLLARDRGEFLPARQILIYPATWNDHSPESPFPSVRENGEDYLLTSRQICSYMDLYLGDHPENRSSPYFAPLLAQRLDHQPDTLIITAEYCPLRDEGEAYGRRLIEGGNTVEIRRIANALHGYMSLPASFVPVRRTYEIINRFLEKEEQS